MRMNCSWWGGWERRYHRGMAGVVHISEAEAARDFAAVVRRVRAAGVVVVDSPDGEIELRVRARTEFSRRTIAEAQEILRRREEECGLGAGNPEFAEVMEEVHSRYNAPMDSSKWE